ncbi:MAG: hypothetical protein RKL32_05790 [Gammaproteobacteria bacterium]
MDIDFSRINLQYLIEARELARVDPERAPVLLGTGDAYARLLAEIPADSIAQLSSVRVPLVVPRQADWWWNRLLTALGDGQPSELGPILEHVELIARR